MSTRWQGSHSAPRGDAYDERWRQLADSGQSIHGEADFIETLLRSLGGTRVLDAGCGTGRVAIELAARGFSTLGVDADPAMLETAREKAPELTWMEADVSALSGHLDGEFDVAVLAGNVMIFVAPGSEVQVLREMAAHVVPGGLVVAGFSLRADRLALPQYDDFARESGLELVSRWATWDGKPYVGGDYAVSVHRRTTTDEH